MYTVWRTMLRFRSVDYTNRVQLFAVCLVDIKTEVMITVTVVRCQLILMNQDRLTVHPQVDRKKGEFLRHSRGRLFKSTTDNIQQKF